MFTALQAIAGAVAGPAANYFSQQDTNRQTVDMANNQMNFQQAMSKTAHQREVEDLMKAGLNPTLSAGGQGASTPQGASGTLTAPKIELPDLMSFGVSLKQLEQADERLAIDKANSAANIAKTASETEINKIEKILKNKGIIRAEAEGEAAKLLRGLFNKVKNVRSPKFAPPPQKNLKNPMYQGE